MPELISGKHILETFDNTRLMQLGAQIASELKQIIRAHKPKILEVEVRYHVIEEDFVNAFEKRELKRNNQPEHQDRDRPRQTAETSGCDLLVEGKTKQEVNGGNLAD